MIAVHTPRAFGQAQTGQGLLRRQMAAGGHGANGFLVGRLAIHRGEEVHAFEVDRFNDMRMAVMASQMASIVRAFDRALEAVA